MLDPWSLFPSYLLQNSWDDSGKVYANPGWYATAHKSVFQKCSFQAFILSNFCLSTLEVSTRNARNCFNYHKLMLVYKQYFFNSSNLNLKITDIISKLGQWGKLFYSFSRLCLLEKLQGYLVFQYLVSLTVVVYIVVYMPCFSIMNTTSAHQLEP